MPVTPVVRDYVDDKFPALIKVKMSIAAIVTSIENMYRQIADVDLVSVFEHTKTSLHKDCVYNATAADRQPWQKRVACIEAISHSRMQAQFEMQDSNRRDGEAARTIAILSRHYVQ